MSRDVLLLNKIFQSSIKFKIFTMCTEINADIISDKFLTIKKLLQFAQVIKSNVQLSVLNMKEIKHVMNHTFLLPQNHNTIKLDSRSF